MQTKTAVNLTQNNADATTAVAKSGDRITYTLSVKNKGLKEEEFTFKDQVSDLLEYADIFDAGGGTLTDDKGASAGSGNAKVLVWNPIKIKPGETQKRSFTVQIKNSIPAMASGKSNPNVLWTVGLITHLAILSAQKLTALHRKLLNKPLHNCQKLVPARI